MSGEQVDMEGLIGEVLEGNRDAFRSVILALEPRVRAVLAAIATDEDFVQDLLQEVFISVYINLARYERGTDVVAWVTQIARNLAHGEIRRRFREAERAKRYRGMLECVAADENHREEPAEHKELLGHLEGCIEGLPARLAAIVRKVYLEHVALKSVAAELGRTSTWLRVTLHRTRKLLSDCVERTAKA